MRTLTALFIALLSAAPGAFAGPEPGEPAKDVCAFCEDLWAIRLYGGFDLSQDVPSLIALEVKCDEECTPEEKSRGESEGRE